MVQRLTQLRQGDSAKVVNISGLSEILRRRLIDMGVTEETEIRVKRVLPLGGPLALESNGQWIGLRRKDAALIEVEV